MKTMSLKEYMDEAKKRFGTEPINWKFVCPICKTEQTAADLVAAGVDRKEVENYIGFSCIGRWTNAGPCKKADKPGKGCDWTLGGLFQLHELEIITDDGVHHPRFALAEKPKLTD